jgi:hypothetical protein
MDLVNVMRRHAWEDKVKPDRVRAVDDWTIRGGRCADVALNDPGDSRQGIHLHPEISALGFSQIRLKPKQNDMGEHA